MNEYILVINPGSTSTKVALFNLLTDKEICSKTIRHAKDDLSQFADLMDQQAYRSQLVQDFLAESGVLPIELKAVAGRGGLLKPMQSGTYLVNDLMLAELSAGNYNSHASNLGAILAHEIAQEIGIKAYIVDPVVVDELQDLARLSGLKGIERRSVGHVLNQKAVARKILAEVGAAYEKQQLIVAHMGGGISLSAHKNGRMIDVVNGLDGEGPYTPERTGSLPLYTLSQLIFESGLSFRQTKRLISGEGGLLSYLGETDIKQLTARMPDEPDIQYYLDGMCYQVAKAIGELAMVLRGDVDRIILTGGMAYSDYIVHQISYYVDWLAPVSIFPGEMEMEALFLGVKRVLNGSEKVKHYD